MAKVKNIGGKARTASDNDMHRLHLRKQSGLLKWQKVMTSRNPDLEVLEGKCVVCLSNIKSDQQAINTKVDGTIFKADNGKYYAKVIGRKTAKTYLGAMEREIDVLPQRANMGDMPSSEDDDYY